MGDFEVFIGEYRHNIDAKGRLSIPAKMRLECGEKVYVTRGNEGCLAVYTVEGWQTYYQSLMQLPKTKKKTRVFIRLVTSRATECEFDKLGRINIPQVLRNEGQLQKECVIVGAGDHIELWDSQMWDCFYDENMGQFDDISENIDDLD